MNVTKEYLKPVIKYYIDYGYYPKEINHKGKVYKFNCNFNNVLIYDNTDKIRVFLFIKINDTIINCLDRLSEQLDDIDDALTKDFLADFEENYVYTV